MTTTHVVNTISALKAEMQACAGSLQSLLGTVEGMARELRALRDANNTLTGKVRDLENRLTADLAPEKASSQQEDAVAAIDKAAADKDYEAMGSEADAAGLVIEYNYSTGHWRRKL